MLFRPDYNDVIEGAFDSGVSREAKTAAWESIAHVLRTSFAESKPRSVEELKRKWNNLETAVKKDIGWCPSISAEATVPETSYNFKKDNPCLPGEIIPGSCDSETLDEKSLKSLYDQVQRGESRLQDIDFEVTDEIDRSVMSEKVSVSQTPRGDSYAPSIDSRVASYVDEMHVSLYAFPLENTAQEGVVGDIEEGLDVIGRREEEDRQSEQYSSYYYHRRYYYDGPGSPAEVQQPSPSTYSRRSRSRSPPNSRDSRKRLGKRKRDLSPERRSARLQQLASRKGPTEPEQSTSNPLVVQGRPEVSPTVSKVDALAKAVVSKQVIRHLTKWISNGLSTTESKTIQGDYKLEFEKNSFSLNPPVLDDWMAHRVKNGSKLKLVGVAEKLWLSAQLKSAEHQKDGPVIQALKAALQQWARAYYHISRRSRHNVLSATVPRTEHLLDDPDAFSSKETLKNLFGQKFLETMLRSAVQEESLNRIEASARSSVGGSQTRRPRISSRGGQIGSSRAVRGSFSGRGQTPYTRETRFVVTPSFPHFLPKNLAVGGRLKYFVGKWSEINQTNGFWTP
ncbi:hypothetical protein OUZ56_029465 [Daphnia magna]|uniref:Regulatory protein zeste n=2 Tax=Daphnia magna TaxID=35525 RepID=A0ABR0B6W7_9CRUS|nr:hypothetical protein OUZ56_029465 [Daphnia magna]